MTLVHSFGSHVWTQFTVQCKLGGKTRFSPLCTVWNGPFWQGVFCLPWGNLAHSKSKTAINYQMWTSQKSISQTKVRRWHGSSLNMFKIQKGNIIFVFTNSKQVTPSLVSLPLSCFLFCLAGYLCVVQFVFLPWGKKTHYISLLSDYSFITTWRKTKWILKGHHDPGSHSEACLLEGSHCWIHSDSLPSKYISVSTLLNKI